MEIEACGITAPEESVTTPLSVAESSCARVLRGLHRSRMANMQNSVRIAWLRLLFSKEPLNAVLPHRDPVEWFEDLSK
jgi:hypothetical protein